MPGSRAASLGPDRPNLLSDLKEAIRDHFDAIRSGPAVLYDSLACHIQPSDIVITFNYDLAVERALRSAGLWDIKTGYGFPIELGDTLSPVEVLKLHGSTNGVPCCSAGGPVFSPVVEIRWARGP